jgi:hypothetical protein
MPSKEVSKWGDIELTGLPRNEQAFPIEGGRLKMILNKKDRSIGPKNKKMKRPTSFFVFFSFNKLIIAVGYARNVPAPRAPCTSRSSVQGLLAIDRPIDQSRNSEPRDRRIM